MASNDVETAMKEYDMAMRLAGDNHEMAFWSALTLATKGNASQALPIFKKVFSADKNWIELLKRLPKTGMVPNNKKGRILLERILNEATKL
ncbi:MAG TPA: hypothetical protein VK487_03075 [Candidatus Bathyarchaeia archaeon]|nr:hypothetical protein [Candidatus Bathyarchaeia archaeon]